MHIAAELHCHTYHSDAQFSPAELAAHAREEQLDLIALTDHNTCSGYSELAKEGLPFIRGIEWTTFYGHMVVLGCRHFVDWRDARIDNIDEKIAEVHAEGGIAGIAHPFSPGSPMCTGCYWDFEIHDWAQVDYMEVWHGSTFPPLASHNIRSKRLWLSRLDEGYRITPTYGRDWHSESYAAAPRACTYLDAASAGELDALKAIRHGRTLLSLGPDAEWSLNQGADVFHAGDDVPAGRYSFRASVDMDRRRERWQRFDIQMCRIVLLGAGERLLAELPPEGGETSALLSAEDRFARMEIHGKACGRECTVALSAPIYIRA